MARPAIFEPEDFLKAALAFIDAEGSDALTTRNLGESIGASHAAVYRHFASKEALLDSLIDDQLGKVLAKVDPNLSGIAQLFNIALAMRSQFELHPNLLRPFISSNGVGKNGIAITRLTVSNLMSLGVQRHRVTFWLRVLENSLIGSLVFEFAASPQHLIIRSQRLNAISASTQLGLTFSVPDVAIENFEAFEFAMKTLLAKLQAEVDLSVH